MIRHRDLPLPWLQALGQLLSLAELKSARLVCRLWALHVTAGAKRVIIWPALLRLPHRSTQTKTTQQRNQRPQSFDPTLLLQGLDSSCEVIILMSNQRYPSTEQMQHLAHLLSASSIQHITLELLIGECSPARQKFNPLQKAVSINRDALQSLCAHPSLVGRLACLSCPQLHAKPCTASHFPAAAFSNLRSLLLCPNHQLSPQHITGIAQIPHLQHFNARLSASAFNISTMQAALDTLAALQQLHSLELNFLQQQASSKLHIPDWPQLTRLVDAAATGSQAQRKVLPARLCSALQELQLGPVELAGGAEELAAATSFMLCAEQLQCGLPGLPEVLHVQAHGPIGYEELLRVLEGLPGLQGLDLSALDHGQFEMEEAAEWQYHNTTAQFFEGLPGVLPHLQGLTTIGSAGLRRIDAPHPGKARRIARAICSITTLRQLHLSSKIHAYLEDSKPLARLPQLQSFSGTADELDIAHLPAATTRLMMKAQHVSSSLGQQQQQHAVPQLLHLDIQPIFLAFGSIGGWQRPVGQLALLQPCLQHVRHLGYYGELWQDNSRGRAGRRSRSQWHVVDTSTGGSSAGAGAQHLPPDLEVLKGLASLQELCLKVPWEGLGRDLQGLAGLTSLVFRQHGLDVQELVLAAQEAVQLRGLRRVAAHSERGMWPLEAVGKVAVELPVCRLEVLGDEEVVVA